VSCGLHDVITLESRGVPAALFGTAPFHHEAEEQARALGMPSQTLIEVPHPIQPLPPDHVAGYADQLVAEAVARITTTS
jgi:hypothetical protein